MRLRMSLELTQITQKAIKKLNTVLSFRQTYYTYLEKRIMTIHNCLENQLQIPWTITKLICQFLYQIEASDQVLIIDYMIETYDYFHSRSERNLIKACLEFLLLKATGSDEDARIIISMIMNHPSQEFQLRGEELEKFNYQVVTPIGLDQFNQKICLEMILFRDNEEITFDYNWA